MRHTHRTTAAFCLALTCAALLLAACPKRRPTPGGPSDRTETRRRAPAGEAAAAPRHFSGKVPAPPVGRLYHGVHPGGAEGEEDAVLEDPGLIDSYAAAAGRQPAFVYFSHEWGHSDDREEDIANHAFPLERVREIAAGGRIPFVRLMLRTSSDEACKKPERYFTLENILGRNAEGERQSTRDIDADLREWGRRAREEYGGPLIVEWGTEANNLTFHWNPACRRGGDKAAAVAIFREAFRHVVRTVTGPEPERSNMTWVFHVAAVEDPDPGASPENAWNRMAGYYPDGTQEDQADVVDWLGVSVYGADNLDTGECETFTEQLERVLGRPDGRGDDERVLALAARGGRRKPVFLLEFGAALNYDRDCRRPCTKRAQCEPRAWVEEAFAELFRRAGRGEISGFSWWNERFEGDGRRRRKLEMRFDHAAGEALTAYKAALGDPRVVHAPAGEAVRRAAIESR